MRVCGLRCPAGPGSTLVAEEGLHLAAFKTQKPLLVVVVVVVGVVVVVVVVEKVLGLLYKETQRKIVFKILLKATFRAWVLPNSTRRPTGIATEASGLLRGPKSSPRPQMRTVQPGLRPSIPTEYRLFFPTGHCGIVSEGWASFPKASEGSLVLGRAYDYEVFRLGTVVLWVSILGGI